MERVTASRFIGASAKAGDARKTLLAGLGLALLAVALWAGNLIAARALRDVVPPISLSFWRWTIGTLTLLPFAPRLSRTQWSLMRRHLGYLSFTGLVGVTTFNTLIYIAAHSTSAANLALIAAVAPVFVAVMAYGLEDEPIGARRAIGMFIAVIGVVALIVGGAPAGTGGLRFRPGDLVMLLAAVSFARYAILVRHRPSGMSGLAFLVGTFGLGTLFLAPLYLAELAVRGGFTPGIGIVGALVYIGIASSALAYAAWNQAIRLIGATRAGFVYYLMPAATAVAAWIVLGEAPSPLQLATMVVIVLGVALGSTAPDNSRPTASTRPLSKSRTLR